MDEFINDILQFGNLNGQQVEIISRKALVDLEITIAKESNATPAQVAIAWMLAQKPRIVPVPGTTKLHRLQENIGGLGISLSGGELNKINAALAIIRIAGDRNPAAMQNIIGK